MYWNRRVPAVVATLGILVVAGCSTSSSSSSTSGSPADGGASASTPIASSSAVTKAKQQATVCLQQTGTAGLLSSAGRSQLVTCLENIVSPAERGAFKNCMASAAVSNQVWTKAGRQKFTSTSLEACLNNAAAATPSASLRGRIQPGGPDGTAAARNPVANRGLSDALISNVAVWLNGDDRHAAAAAQILLRNTAVQPLLAVVHTRGRGRLLGTTRPRRPPSGPGPRAGGHLLTEEVERDLEPVWIGCEDWPRTSGADSLNALDDQKVRFNPLLD